MVRPLTGASLGTVRPPNPPSAAGRTAKEVRLLVEDYDAMRHAPVPEGESLEDRLALFTDPRRNEMVVRWDMVQAPPDILVTNFSMLNALLMRDVEANMFACTRPWLEESREHVFTLVVDELHLHRGTSGSEVGMVLRNLLARIGLAGDSPQLRVIGTSASLYDDPSSTSSSSSGSLGPRSRHGGRATQASGRPEGQRGLVLSVGPRRIDASAQSLSDMVASACYDEETEGCAPPRFRWSPAGCSAITLRPAGADTVLAHLAHADKDEPKTQIRVPPLRSHHAWHVGLQRPGLPRRGREGDQRARSRTGIAGRDPRRPAFPRRPNLRATADNLPGLRLTSARAALLLRVRRREPRRVRRLGQRRHRRRRVPLELVPQGARSEPPAGLQARSNGVPLVPARHHLGPSLPVHRRRPELCVPARRPRTGNGPAIHSPDAPNGVIVELTSTLPEGSKAPALPDRCPACHQRGATQQKKERVQKGEIRTPIRAHTAGASAATEVYLGEMTRRMGANRTDRKTLVFTDSRDDAAKTAAGVEANHHRDQLRAMVRSALTAQQLSTVDLLRRLVANIPMEAGDEVRANEAKSAQPSSTTRWSPPTASASLTRRFLSPRPSKRSSTPLRRTLLGRHDGPGPRSSPTFRSEWSAWA